MTAQTRSTAADAGSDELAELIARVAGGDRTALRTLYERTCAKLFGVALGIVARRDAAEDVLQESFVRIWREAGSYDPDRARPMTWLITITRNRAIDRRRHEARRPSGGDDGLDTLADGGRSPEDLALTARASDALAKCLEELGAAAAVCIRLAYLAGYSHSEVAARVGEPLGTVKSRIRRGLLHLKECLER